MAAWQKETLMMDGEPCLADMPVIISASRATDIPAFYGDWLRHRLERHGFVAWRNPFNGKTAPVGFSAARLFVFWSKNPAPFLPHLEVFERRGLNTLFHFTLNDYDAERFEPGVPPLAARIKTFRELARRLGRERVVWRFDPLVLTDTLTVDALLDKVKRVGDGVHDVTRRLVFSFADIADYANVRRNLAAAGVRARAFREEEVRAFADGLAALNRGWGLELATCAEAVDLAPFGIGHAHCIDAGLIRRLFAHDAELMGHLDGGGDRKDSGQRAACGCIRSKDIGAYATCPHLCVYCYANASAARVRRNHAAHLAAPGQATLCPPPGSC